MRQSLTIDQTVFAIVIVLIIGGGFAMLVGGTQIRSARKLRYFLLRRERIMAGWRLVGLGAVLVIAGLVGTRFGRQAAYVIVRPTPSVTSSPTITRTPTITSSPTVTLTPTITATPSITYTPTASGTPQLPPEIQILMRSTEPVDEDPLFSQPVLARRLDRENQPISPAEDFYNPVGTLYAAFTYNNLRDDVRWTAIWYLGQDIICLETQLWDGGTGGYGYTECSPEAWMAGEYEIRIFWGTRWMTSVRFEVIGETATVTPLSIPEGSSTPSG